MKNISFIGAGKMTQAFLKGWKAAQFDLSSLKVSSRTGLNLSALNQQYGLQMMPSNLACIQEADILFLAVKPQNLEALIQEIRNDLSSNTLIVSMAAAVDLACLEVWFNKPVKLVRIMPNTAISIQMGSIALCHTAQVSQKDVNDLLDVLNPLGSIYPLEEKYFDTFIAASGSGIAFAYQIMSDFILGLGENGSAIQAQSLVLETFKAASMMTLSQTSSLQERIDEVCSKAGTTIEGIKVLQEAKLSSTFEEAFKATIARSIQLNQELRKKSS